MMSAVSAFHIPSGSTGSSVSRTTKMMNLLTLVLVTMPGLALSFSNSYVCCNQPPTYPPSPFDNKSNLRSLILTLAKRDERNAPVRVAREDALGRRARVNGGRRDADTGATPWNIPGLRERGDYSNAARRDPLLAGILHVLRSTGRHKDSNFSPRGALTSSVVDPASLNIDASELMDKRGGDDETGTASN